MTFRLGRTSHTEPTSRPRFSPGCRHTGFCRRRQPSEEGGLKGCRQENWLGGGLAFIKVRLGRSGLGTWGGDVAFYTRGSCVLAFQDQKKTGGSKPKMLIESVAEKRGEDVRRKSRTTKGGEKEGGCRISMTKVRAREGNQEKKGKTGHRSCDTRSV